MTDREIDAAIAEKVMGWKWWVKFPKQNQRAYIAPTEHVDRKYVGGSRGPHVREGDAAAPRYTDWDRLLPHYSIDIAAAMEAAEKMIAGGWLFTLYFDEEDSEWACIVGSSAAPHVAPDPSPARAICLAILRAKGVEV